jgi:hypothetical protein
MSGIRNDTAFACDALFAMRYLRMVHLPLFDWILCHPPRVEQERTGLASFGSQHLDGIHARGVSRGHEAGDDHRAEQEERGASERERIHR